jgi:hypothetical protein
MRTTALLGGVSSLQLPEQFGVAGIRVYGSASASGDPAHLRMMAIGGVNAVAGIDTILRVDLSVSKPDVDNQLRGFGRGRANALSQNAGTIHMAAGVEWRSLVDLQTQTAAGRFSTAPPR